MPHPSSLRALLAAAAMMLLVLIGCAGVPATAATDDTPLLVHLDSITPTVPRNGDVVITGRVTNTTDVEYTRINLHAFASQSPISDSPALSASAATDADEYVGARITEAGTFDTVDVLEPKATTTFTVRVPVELLAMSQPGVYWIGIHAIGDGLEPRDASADGRARTFIPVLPEGRQRAEATIVVPLRHTVRYDADGAIAHTGRWLSLLRDGGRLAELLMMAEEQPAEAFSWLVDPAVLDAITRLADGNPPRSLDPAPESDEGPDDATEPSPDPDESPSPDEDAGEATGDPDDTSELSQLATQWLERFVASTTNRDVLALPYADLDVSAAVRQAPTRLEDARRRSNEVLAQLGIDAEPMVAPIDGTLSPEALAAVPATETLLLGEQAFAAPPESPHSVVDVLGRTVVVTSAGAQMGGPGPTPAHDPLALRQRVISEAALRLMAGTRAPVVLTLPSRWDEADAAVLFSLFDRPWLSPAPLLDVADRRAVELEPESMPYPEADQEHELDADSFATAEDFLDTAAVMEDVLTAETTVEAQVLDEALVTLSQHHRARPDLAISSARAGRDFLADQLASITVEAPTAVALSSSSGPVGASVINGLDQPVSVRLVADADDDLVIEEVDVRTLAAGARTSVRFQATVERPGVHDVVLRVTSPEGEPLGASASVPIRAAQVSGIIWIVMATGAALLFATIGLRLLRRIRARARRREAAHG